MKYKENFENTSENKGEILPLEDFSEEFVSNLEPLLEDRGLSDFNNQGEMQVFLSNIAHSWQQQEGRDFIILHEALNQRVEGKQQLKEQSEQLFKKFNQCLLSEKNNSIFSNIKDYVSEYPLLNEENQKFIQDYSNIDKEQVANLNDIYKDKYNNIQSETDAAFIALGLHLDYLYNLRNLYKEQIFAGFQNMRYQKYPDKFLALELEEVEALYNGYKDKKNKASGKFEKKLYPVNPSLSENDFINDEDKKGLKDYYRSWKGYLLNHNKWKKISDHISDLQNLRHQLSQKKLNLEKELDVVKKDPEQIKNKIIYKDLGQFWFGDDQTDFSYFKKLNKDERLTLLATINKGSDNVVDFTVEWLNKDFAQLIEKLVRQSGYLKVNDDKENKLKLEVNKIHELFPDNFSMYEEDNKQAIIKEWFEPYEYKHNDEDESGKFLRLNYLLRSALKSQNKYFLKDDDSFNLLLGEIKELGEKEIKLNAEEFKKIRDILLDNSFVDESGLIQELSNEDMQSFIDDIYSNEQLTMVQEKKWQELLSRIKHYINKFLQSEIEYNKDLQSIDKQLSDLHINISGKSLNEIGDVDLTAGNIKVLYDFYQLAKRS